MTGKGFDPGKVWRRFIASSIHGEISDATIQGYLRSASQIEEIWQQIDDKVALLIAQGMAPWDAYAKMGYALAFARACRADVVFVQELLHADAVADPSTAGYLPKVTYDQAMALCQHIEPLLEEAIIALNNPRYVPSRYRLPIKLGPRIESEGQRCPLPHLQGILAAGRQTREWAAGLLAAYELAIGAATTPVPEAITAHIEEMHGDLALADFHLQTGIDLVGQISQGDVTSELHEQAEDMLWEAIVGFSMISQLVADPLVLTQSTPNSIVTANGKQYRDRRVTEDDLWQLLASASARDDLQKQQRMGVDPRREPRPGEEPNLALEMWELHTKMHGILPAETQQALDDIAAAVRRGDAAVFSSWASCPYDPAYRTKRQLSVAGTTIPANYEFHWNIHYNNYRGGVEMAQRFGSRDGWDEAPEDDE